MFSIEENTLNFGHTFSAFDSDYGVNASLFYYITRHGDKTYENVKILYTALDYENRKGYEFELTCSDSGEPFKLTTLAKIVVDVVDLNDNAPEFKRKSERMSYVETRFQKGFSLYKCEAFDSDPSEKFHQTSYRLKSIYRATNSMHEYAKDESLLNSFGLNAKSGELVYDSNFKLSSLITNEYIIQLEAVDDNKPELRDEFNLTLIVLPSNDKLPVFERNYGSNDFQDFHSDEGLLEDH